jgi:hypothetical protein
VLRYRIQLEQEEYAAATINVRLAEDAISQHTREQKDSCIRCDDRGPEMTVETCRVTVAPTSPNSDPTIFGEGVG